MSDWDDVEFADYDDVTAYHEAGHAVVAIYLGGIVRSVTIVPDRDDGPERYGDASIGWDTNRFTSAECRRRGSFVALGGPVAEMIYRGEPYHPGFVAEWSNDWRTAWEAMAPLLPEKRKRMTYLEQVTRELHALLDDEIAWAGLASVADHLLAHERLDHEMLCEILHPWLSTQ